MKKKGTTFIEIIVAITIFLIAILPIAYLTLNSLKAMKRSSEIEEGARVTTTVINYIKSQGYTPLIDGLLSSDNPASQDYLLRLSDDKSSYTLDITPSGGDDFEEDFLGGAPRTSQIVSPEDSLFLISSLGIASEEINISVNVATSNLELLAVDSDGNLAVDSDGDYIPKTYIDPVTNATTSSGLIIVDGLINRNSVIFGNVYISYETKSDTSKDTKDYKQNFVITPIENFTTSP